ncbi:MAG: homoserine kinase [Actinomycetota bacterium]
MDVEVRVPASAANLGPGFDCLGAAIEVYLRVRVEGAAAPEVAGKGTLRPPDRNLTHRAFRAAYEAAGREAPPVRVEVLETYPSARGLGASASAIVAGLVAAQELGDLGLPAAELAGLAVRIEGHADNVLPALFGGVVVASREGWLHLDPTPRICPIVLVAPEPFRTVEARAVLPAEVPRADAVANAASAAALVAVLGGMEPPDALMMATEDRLHQPYRLPLMPESHELLDALRAKGIAAVLSGAGPSLLCLVEVSALDACRRVARELAPEGWDVLAPSWDLRGAQVR